MPRPCGRWWGRATACRRRTRGGWSPTSTSGPRATPSTWASCCARFVHALVREALYQGLPPSRRRGWHRRAGEVLAAEARPDPDAVAYHFRRAGDPRAAAWLLRAGERAQAAYAWLSAAERFEAAL